MSAPRLFVIADVGGPGHFHVGDEAMLEANLERLRRLDPSLEFTVASNDPRDTERRYGVQSVRIPPLDAAPPAGMWDEVTAALAGSAGLVVSGGGNLCSTWPRKIDERVALGEIAYQRGLPVVVLGQTLGPLLSPDERARLGTMLRQAAYVGVRELPSAALASELGVHADRLHYQLDDAYSLAPSPPERARMASLDLDQDSRPLILVTIDPSYGAAPTDGRLVHIAEQLDGLAEATGGRLLFVPGCGGPGAPEAVSDHAAGRRLGRLAAAPLPLIDVWAPREIRWLCERAALVVSTRYHPLVFACAAGIPALGIFSDEYTRVKLRGALAHPGLERWALSDASAARGGLLRKGLSLWMQRDEVGARLARFNEEALPADRLRDEEIGRALALRPAKAADSGRGSQPRTVSERRAPAMLQSLTENHWITYDLEGYLRLGRVLDDDALNALRQRIDDIMLGKVVHPGLQAQLDTGGAYEELPDPVEGIPTPSLAYRKIQGLERDPLFRALVQHPLFREICAHEYGAHAAISIFRAMVMNKPASQGTVLPWHQDAGDVWKLDRDPVVTIWVALDAATRANGCMQIVSGTQRLGLLSHFGSTVSDANVARHCPEDAIEYLEVEAGEAILMHNWLLHRSDVNRTSTPRRAFTVCYMDARTVATTTGALFPVVFGEPPEAPAESHPYLRALQEDRLGLRAAAEESERYAKSLREESTRLRELREETETYAKSLLEDNARLRTMREEAERYAKSLEAARGPASG
jgi:polysaccharide pyruvyl transferase WcaK-like protein/ectoine hydroxylase-related dioxygenase (phytanoyl-CoA dioxygenase family)